MTNYENNILEHPEVYGAEVIASIGIEQSYEFDMVVVWKKGNLFYFGTDGGCSCPTPFETYTGIEDLNLFNSPDSYRGFEDAVKRIDTTSDKKDAFLRKVHSAMYTANDILKEYIQK